MKRVLFIGAGFLQKFVINRAKELGYSTLAIDGNPHSVGFANADEYETIDIRDAVTCCEYARDHDINGVMTAATDYGVITTAHIAHELGLPGITLECAELVKNKYSVYKRLFEAKTDDTDIIYEIDNLQIADVLKSTIQYPVMVKPCDGSGSRGASKVTDSICFVEACQAAIENSKTRKAVVTPFITGVEYGAESIVIKGQPYVLSIMKKWMTQPPYYAELGHVIPSGLPAAVEQKTIKTVEQAIIALGITTGAVNMDMLITDKGKVHIIDVGARMGGNLIGSHIIPLGTGYDYMSNLIRLAVGDEPDIPYVNSINGVATKILALHPGAIKSLPDFSIIAAQTGVDIEHHLNIGDEIMPYRTNLDGCGYVIAHGESVNECARKCSEALEIIDNTIIRE